MLSMFAAISQSAVITLHHKETVSAPIRVDSQIRAPIMFQILTNSTETLLNIKFTSIEVQMCSPQNYSSRCDVVNDAIK